MKRWSIFAISAVLAACGGSVPPNGRETSLTPLSTARVAAEHAAWVQRPQYPDRGASWASPGIKKIKRLLYVSDYATNDVFVYDYKTGSQVGKLTGFRAPAGQCVDAKGDVWIANYKGKSVVEYAYGGFKRIATLRAGKENQGCAVDPTTGNLAVASLTRSGHAILIWKNAQGTPTTYTSQSCFYVWVPAYDRRGNLYVEGEESDGTIEICELPHGGSALEAVASNLPIVYPANVVWDGKYLAFGDQEFNHTLQSGIYQATESASGDLTLAGSTELEDDVCGYSDVVEPFVVGKKNTPLNRRQGSVVIGENFFCRNRLDYWAYPAGGTPFATLQAAPYIPSGVSLSIGK